MALSAHESQVRSRGSGMEASEGVGLGVRGADRWPEESPPTGTGALAPGFWSRATFGGCVQVTRLRCDPPKEVEFLCL